MISKFVVVVKTLFKKHYFGFIKGHDYLSFSELKSLKFSISHPEVSVRSTFEDSFSGEIGQGKCLSYASGRMAFYSLLRAFKVTVGDEVIITGFTCSVMVNAIIRVGATPVYVDVDPDNYGTSPEDILKKLSVNTRVIVAQHSFGIPCRIDEIQSIAEKNNLKLIEDCALAFKSKYKGRMLGNFGDAAIFSTDHSKPINTITGGVLYTNDTSLYSLLRKAYEVLPDLSLKHQRNIHTQIRLERVLCNPSMNRFYTPLMVILNFLELIKLKRSPTFMNSDSGVNIKNSTYSYPAKMPLFLCELGIKELDRFDLLNRRLIADEYIKILDASILDVNIPNAYKDKEYEIVPLRFVCEIEEVDLRSKIENFVDANWFWFKAPIISTSDSLLDFNYEMESCPNSEKIGKTIINLPVILSEQDARLILNKLEEIV